MTVLLGSSGVCWSADFEKGFYAHDRGDFATALKELRPLAKQGHADAQTTLGWMYYKGQGVPQDDKTAAKWWTLAAEQGIAFAQNRLGQMYRTGEGVPQDYKTAVKWYTLAAEQGHAFAQGNLGVLYAFGQGKLKDYVYAHMWGNIAALNGNELGEKLRDDYEKQMTTEQIAEAQKLARECVKKDYKNC